MEQQTKTKNKYNILSVKEEEDKKGQKRDIVKVSLNTECPVCIECNKNKRQDASSRCKECSDSYRMQKFDREKLQKKIENQGRETILKQNKKI